MVRVLEELSWGRWELVEVWGGERESKGCIGPTETTRPPGEATSREAVQGFTPEANERSGLEGRY